MTLTIVIACYGQPKIMAHQLETIAKYDDHILDQLHVCIVDDHGDPPMEVPEDFKAICDIRLFRVIEDIPWNQMGARNIGMREAPSDWCVMLDPDMVIEPEMISRFVAKAKISKRGQIFKFGLKHQNGSRKIDYSSPNSWLIHREDFFACGGYDEDFRGHKGWSDCLLQETLKAFYQVVDVEGLHVSFHLPSDGFDDAMVLSLDRSVVFNKKLKQKKNTLVKKMGGFRRYISRRGKGTNFRCKTKRVL